MRVMDFKKLISYLNLKESLKEIELNNILDKISKKMNLSSKEQEFLGKYDYVTDDDLKDFRMLSLQSTFEKIQDLMSKNKRVICNLIDRDGKINTEILSLYSDYENEKFTLTLKHGEKIELQDNYLYNIIYNLQKDNYSLEAGEQFFEKIKVQNED
jgi:hypothetical protein